MSEKATYTILGAGRSGLAVARLLSEEGAEVFVSDARPESESFEQIEILELLGLDYEFGGHTDRSLDAETIVLSPGVPPSIPVLLEAEERGVRITNEIEIASCFCDGTIIGITGTNGKTTTAELIGHICREAGKKAFVAGNVGTPFSTIARQADAESIVVLELSSFQLERIESFHPHVAVLLNVTPDHMDRYESIEEYGSAKLWITTNQDESDWLIFNGDDKWLRRIKDMEFKPERLECSIRMSVEKGAFLDNENLTLRMGKEDNVEQVISASEIGIRGPHNLVNSMAAALATRVVGVSGRKISEGLRSFRSLPHRLEDVALVNGVRYVNDSKGTNTDALRFALASFEEPIVLIAGGRAKKNDYSELLRPVRERVKVAVLIGEAANEMADAFSELITVLHAEADLELAVEKAREVADPGDVVLLSPACASFDMFKNFAERGNTFKEIVRQLHQSSLTVEGS